MASPVIQIIETQQLTATPQLYYQSAAGVWTQIVALGCANVDAAPRQITIYLIPAGGSGNATTITTPALTLLAGKNYNGANEYGMVLNPGDGIWAFADTAFRVNIFASGLQLT